jgi:hypothetical protein
MTSVEMTGGKPHYLEPNLKTLKRTIQENRIL